MGRRRVAWWVAGVLWLGCAHHGATSPAPAVAQSSVLEVEGNKYVNPKLGFEVSRPEAHWQLDRTGDPGSEGMTIPVILRHTETGAQVFIHVAPAIATPTQYAERLNSGLRSYPGFTASDPEPLPLSDDAVGFRFAMGEKVHGRIAVREGGKGQVFTLMATWPADVEEGVTTEVDQIFGSLHPIPHG
jgi:hypothetical protein